MLAPRADNPESFRRIQRAVLVGWPRRPGCGAGSRPQRPSYQRHDEETRPAAERRRVKEGERIGTEAGPQRGQRDRDRQHDAHQCFTGDQPCGEEEPAS